MVKYNSAGVFQLQFGNDGVSAGQVKGPHSIGTDRIDGVDYILVVDTAPDKLKGYLRIKPMANGFHLYHLMVVMGE